MTNLHIVVPLIGFAAIAAWWLRGVIAKGSIEGLREQNNALREHNNALVAHRQFAERKDDKPIGDDC